MSSSGSTNHSSSIPNATSKSYENSRGLTRKELTKIYQTGGRFTNTLTELEEADFIHIHPPFAKTSRDSIYRLFDEYSLFSLKWIDGHL